MNIVVTGGAGFLGSHLCDALIQQGHTVFCVDNFFTGNQKNIAHLRDNEKFHLLPHDIVEPLHIQEKIDQIYNLACPASPPHYQHDPVKTVRANTEGVIHLLELAKLHQARILQASTSEVYGDPLEHPQKESYRGNVNTMGPRACYDEGKRAAETLFFSYWKEHGVEIRIARIFNTYGPRMAENDGRVVSNFILQALRNEPITMYGEGQQTRSFCYVADLVKGLIALMNGESVGPINMGNPGEFTIKELAEKIISLTHSSSEIIYQELPQDDPVKRKPDITLAKEKLSWEPIVDLEEGLQKTIMYFEGNNAS